MSKKKSATPQRASVAIEAPDAEDAPMDPGTEAILAAFRRGDVATMRMLGPLLFGDEATAPTVATAPAPASSPLVSAEIVQRVRRDREELEGMDPDAGADEKLLMRLVSDSLPSVMMLADLSERLTAHMPGLLDKPATLRIVATALRDAVSLRNSMLHRTQSLLSSVAALRGQRRFLQRRGGPNGA